MADTSIIDTSAHTAHTPPTISILQDKDLAHLFASLLDTFGPLYLLTITHVRASWRRVALHTPTLWADIPLSPARAYALAEWRAHESGSRSIRTLDPASQARRRLEQGYKPVARARTIASLELARLWTERAGEAQIDVTLSFATLFVVPDPHRWNMQAGEDPVYYMRPALLPELQYDAWLALLESLRPRLRVLRLSAPTVSGEIRKGKGVGKTVTAAFDYRSLGVLPVDELMQRLLGAECPNLAELRTSPILTLPRQKKNHTPTRAPPAPLPLPQFPLHAPSLQNLSLTTPGFEAALPSLTHLTSLSLRASLALRTLRLLPPSTLAHLRRLRIHVAPEHRTEGDGTPDFTIAPGETFALPALTHLVTPFPDLTYLTTPALAHLQIALYPPNQRPNHVITSDANAAALPPSGKHSYLTLGTVRGLVESGAAAALRSLSIENAMVVSSAITALFLACTSLRTLHLSGIISPNALSALECPYADSEASGTRGSGWLCPNLRVLEVGNHPMKDAHVSALLHARVEGLAVRRWEDDVDMSAADGSDGVPRPARLISLVWDGEEMIRGPG